VVRTGKGRRGSPFRYALLGRTLADDLPELPPLAEELGIPVSELIKIEFKHLQKVLKLRQLEAEKE
jgi:hypothetical protein